MKSNVQSEELVLPDRIFDNLEYNGSYQLQYSCFPAFYHFHKPFPTTEKID